MTMCVAVLSSCVALAHFGPYLGAHMCARLFLTGDGEFLLTLSSNERREQVRRPAATYERLAVAGAFAEWALLLDGARLVWSEGSEEQTTADVRAAP